MQKYVVNWKKMKTPPKSSVKSFRETIDFPEECFTSPKCKENRNISFRGARLKSHNAKSSCFSVKKASNAVEKLNTHNRGNKSFRSGKDSCTSKASNSKKVKSSASKLKDLSTAFNNSFDEDLLKDEKGSRKSCRRNILVPENPEISDAGPAGTEGAVSVERTRVEPEAEITEQAADESVDQNDGNMDGQSIDDEFLDLSNWGLPESVVDAYLSQNISKMFRWQAECLSMKNVLKGGNLVYSAPTSAGKTLVAEVLMLKKVLESRKKGLMILPYVSVTREKVNYLQRLFRGAGVTVDGYMGTYHPPGGFNAVDIAICTIEKANNLVNRLMEDGRIDQLGIVVVDELHMLGDPHRGYLLELLLTKLLYTCKKNELDHVQIVGMSATLPNLEVLALWLNSELYRTTFRPVPLTETFKVGSCVYNAKTFSLIRDLSEAVTLFPNDADHTVFLAMETVISGHSVLIFCPSRVWCEKLAESIAREVCQLGRLQPGDVDESSTKTKFGARLREVLDGNQLKDVLDQLTSSPAGLDSILGRTVPFGVAFHHAGLTFDERDIIESAFRFGIVKFLVATTTLSSGVNLPAKRVIIRSPLFRGSLIDVLSYKQMVGRAGRKGIDSSGESILLCKENERNFAKMLIESDLRPVRSCLIMSGDNNNLHSSIKRAILEIVASGVARTLIEIMQYMSCTLLSAAAAANKHGTSSKTDVDNALGNCLQYLISNEFIHAAESKAEDDNDKVYQPTRLGQAVLASGFSPDDSLRMLKELQVARQCFVLDSDLHILYEVTPPYLSDQFGDINWLHFLSLWEELPDGLKRVGNLVGVEEQFVGRRIQGHAPRGQKETRKLAIHQRFYAALALNDLIQEMPLSKVARKYNCSRGILQSLQQTTSTFAGMLTMFCNRLGWQNMELLFINFQKRVHFGIQQELCDLVRLSSMNGQRARVLYNGGYETVAAVASAEPGDIALLLANSAPFESTKEETEKDSSAKDQYSKFIYISGQRGMSAKEAAWVIVCEARRMIEQELGIKNLEWKSGQGAKSTGKQNDVIEVSGVDSTSGSSSKNDIQKEVNASEERDAPDSADSTMIENDHEVSNSEIDSVAPERDSPKNHLESSKIVIKSHDITDNGDDKVSESPLKKRKLNDFPDSPDTGNDLTFVAKSQIKRFESRNLETSAIQNENLSILLVDSLNESKFKHIDMNHNSFFKNIIDTFCESADDTFLDPANTAIHDDSVKEDLLTQAAEMESICLSDSFYSKLYDFDYELEPKNLKSQATPCSSTPLSNNSDVLGLVPENTCIDKIQTDGYMSGIQGIGNSPSLLVDQLNIDVQETRTLAPPKSSLNAELQRKEENDDSNDTGELFAEDGQADKSPLPDTEAFLEDSLCLVLAHEKSYIEKSFLKSPSVPPKTNRNMSNEIHHSTLDLSFDSPFSAFLSPVVKDRSMYQKKNIDLTKSFHLLNGETITGDLQKQCFYTSSDFTLNLDSEEQFTFLREEKDRADALEGISNSLLNPDQNALKNERQPPVDSGFSSKKTCSYELCRTEKPPPRDDLEQGFGDLCNDQNKLSHSCDHPGDEQVSEAENRKLPLRHKSCPLKLQSCQDDVASTCSSSPLGSVLSPKTACQLASLNGKAQDVHHASKTMSSCATNVKHPESENFQTTVKSHSILSSYVTRDDAFDDGDSDLFSSPPDETQVQVEVDGNPSRKIFVKMVSDSDFHQFVCLWKSAKKFSFSLACEKYTQEAILIGPKITQKKNEDSACKWTDGKYDVVGMSVCLEDSKVFYVPFQCKCSKDGNLKGTTCKEMMRILSDIFEKHLTNKTVMAYDLKKQYRILCAACKIIIHPNAMTIFQDPSIASWLLNPESGKTSLSDMVADFLAQGLSLIEENEHGSIIDDTATKGKACYEAMAVFHLMDELTSLLLKHKLLKPFLSVEMPVQLILAKMERNGIGFDGKLACSYHSNMQQQQQQLCDKAHHLARRKFNLNSSKDIARVLYKELRLLAPNGATQGASSPVANKHLAIGVSGYRKKLPPELKTNKEGLEKLKYLHPLPEIILNWRKVSFCVTKVLTPMLRAKSFCNALQINRLHSSCYVYTVTGRINMHSPNLQFVPRDFDVDSLRGEEESSESDEPECSYEDAELFGITLRNMFIPCKGHVLVAADYSQIELRLIAHLSGDRKLLSLLNSGGDVFKMVASNLNAIPEDKVNDSLRQQAKKICYSIIYGITTQTLSKQLGTTPDEAAIFMQSFMDAYPSVKSYLKKLTEDCRKHGYVLTLGGRRRYLPSIRSDVSSEKAQAERQAVNTTVQGSAADLVKSAMIRIEQDMSVTFPRTQKPMTLICESKSGQRDCSINNLDGGFLVLHLHDELIYEVQESSKYIVARIIKKNMENSMKLKVKLPVKVKVGSSWGKMTEMNI